MPLATFRRDSRTFLQHSPSRTRLFLLCGIGLAICLCVVSIRYPALLRRVELQFYDRLLASLPPGSNYDEVVVVDIDERSLAEHGQWPWPRSWIQTLLENIENAGAASIGVDIILAEPDRYSAEVLRKLFAAQPNEVVLDIADHDFDRDLAEFLISAPNVVIGSHFKFDGSKSQEKYPLPFLEIVVRRDASAPGHAPVPRATHGTFPNEKLRGAVQRSAFLDARPDVDGTIRRAPSLIEYQGLLIPSLSLAAVMGARDASTAVVFVGATGIETISVGDLAIPTDAAGNVVLPFRREPLLPLKFVSAADVMANSFPSETFSGKIVLVGSSADALQDSHPTPHSNSFPGIAVHAIAAGAMLTGDVITAPAWSAAGTIAAILFATLFATILLSRFNAVICALAISAALVALLLGARWLLVSQHLYLSPVSPAAALSISAIALGLLRFRSEEKRVLQTTRDLAAAQDCAIRSLVSIAETRDPETGAHIIRTQHYTRLLAERLARNPKFKKSLTREVVEAITRSAPLHDVGKVGVPDRVLLKPAKLNAEEFAIMKTHTTMGHEVLRHAELAAGLKGDTSFLNYAAEIALSHHEKWDGTGYPNGNAGEMIPISARLMALADVYDALRSKRHYKPAFTHERAAAIIKEESGRHFDPDVVDAFVAVEAEFVRMANRYGDEDAPPSSLHSDLDFAAQE